MPNYEDENYYGEWEALVDLAQSIERDEGECPEHLRGFVKGGEPRDVEGYTREGVHYWRED